MVSTFRIFVVDAKKICVILPKNENATGDSLMGKNFRRHLSQLVYLYRTRNGLSKRQVAHESGTSVRVVSDIENERLRVAHPAVLRLLKGLGLQLLVIHNPDDCPDYIENPKPKATDIATRLDIHLKREHLVFAAHQLKKEGYRTNKKAVVAYLRDYIYDNLELPTLDFEEEKTFLGKWAKVWVDSRSWLTPGRKPNYYKD